MRTSPSCRAGNPPACHCGGVPARGIRRRLASRSRWRQPARSCSPAAPRRSRTCRRTSSSIVVDGTVNAVVTSGSTIVLGGSFSRAGAYTGGFVGGTGRGRHAVLAPGRSTAPSTPSSRTGRAAGTSAAASRRSGPPRSRTSPTSPPAAASTRAWNPAPNAQVNALALSSDGKTLFVGGAFATIGSSSRNDIAALTASTGAADVLESERGRLGDAARALARRHDALRRGLVHGDRRRLPRRARGARRVERLAPRRGTPLRAAAA